jgi:hypothetical protein
MLKLLHEEKKKYLKYRKTQEYQIILMFEFM